MELADEYIKKGDYLKHWEQESAAHVAMNKIWEKKFDEQKDTLSVVSSTLLGIEEHLRKLNGSVSKHEQRHNAQDVLNAQMALSLNQASKSLESVAEMQKETTEYMLRADGAISTGKWIIGLIGVGTLVMIIKSFFIL